MTDFLTFNHIGWIALPAYECRISFLQAIMEELKLYFLLKDLVKLPNIKNWNEFAVKKCMAPGQR